MTVNTSRLHRKRFTGTAKGDTFFLGRTARTQRVTDVVELDSAPTASGPPSVDTCTSLSRDRLPRRGKGQLQGNKGAVWTASVTDFTV